MLTTNQDSFRHQHIIPDSTKCLDFNYSTFYTSKHYHSDMPKKGYDIHEGRETNLCIETTNSL